MHILYFLEIVLKIFIVLWIKIIIIKQNLDYDDDLLDIKPPKLFIETNKNEINDINEIPHLKTEQKNKVENN